MHSRVAAVMAPRTHNRRRVTGSSGRRREGRESEPQRPNMSRHLFYSAMLLLLFVMMCCGSGGTGGVAGQSDDPQFEWKGITEGRGETVESLGAASLLKVGSDVFAVAEAQCKNGDVSFTGVASQPLTTQTADTSEELFSDALKKTQVLEEGASEGQKKKVDVSRPTTAVKRNDIYMLAGVYSSKVATPGQVGASDAAQLGLLLVKGSVNSGDANSKKIDWKVTESSPQKLFEKQPDSWTRLIGSGGSGVKMKDETLVFPVEGTKKAADGTEVDVKTVSLIIYSKDNTNWKLPKGMSDGGCSDPSVVEWEDDKLIMMAACDGGRRRVYESGDKGESWTEALGTLSRVWGNNKKGEEAKTVRSGFITATVGNDGDNKKVMLVTLPVYAEKDKEKGKLHLWLTDNTHIVDIGPVSGDDDKDVAASSLLYNSGENTNEKEDELIALYEKKKDGGKPSPGMVSVPLTEQLQRVKDVLTTWKEVDGRVSQLCTSLIAEKERASTDDVCSATVKITTGLVGFLSGNLSGNTWRDEYLGVNATVNNNEGAKQAENGVKFTGRGAGAEWPVGSQGENQLYHFANYNFTLVATVSIDNVPKSGSVPLMGVRAGSKGDENNVLLGLSYDSEKKWWVLCGDKTTTKLSSTWETGTPQHVAIMLQNGTQGSVYVDGQLVGGNGECALGNGESKGISHFYIGGNGGSAENKEDVSVTVTNVLLYNRPLDDTEIAALNPNKASTPPAVNAPSQGTAIETSPGAQGKEEQRQSLGSSGADGVSASTVSSAKTSSGGEGSATQLVTEESSDGSKNVGGASSPGSEAAVETGDRSTVQGDGSSQTLVGTPATADAYAPNAEAMGHDGTAVNPGASASSGADGETAEGTDGQEKEEIHAQNGDVKAAALSSSLGNLSQGNNSDACSVCGSGLLPSLLLLLLLGLWGFAAL
ncbi:putative trans-sialidase, Group V [Trypanosoma cruzi]|uniref:Trans-sialidase, putative n=2 Tax=Trypanosoma cruzi TaxID=5693 RepID=Q4DDR3_TRYCC|nr:trans-sialidase, putative [Trypanosoma cruzi]EAN90664.1 trans-sialidase, putative [Trypanosoma cruzi]PWV08428.1 putative trans-sialidase, Group V [Trypanosoma cruzi]|eukprot:XP_812515.1 trans-sialidase [Trypanosoma cruzi strain CL Brener]